ncbi:MAG: hypothetical protein RJA52_1087 [Bacteroidota bacterium]
MFIIGAFSASGQVMVNPKIGVNASNFDTQIRDIRAEARIGWNAGVDFRIGKGMFSFIPGLHYYSFTTSTVPNVGTGTNFDVRQETTIQNVKLPINFGLRLTGQGGLMSIWLKGGGVANMFAGIREGSTPTPLLEEDFSKVNFAANAGIGMDILVFTIEATYEMGLTPFFETGNEKNNMLVVSAGIRF